MYKAFLSYAQLKDYLTTLIENGLLDFNKASGTYRTTEKGRRFMHVYQNLAKLSGEMTMIETGRRSISMLPSN